MCDISFHIFSTIRELRENRFAIFKQWNDLFKNFRQEGWAAVLVNVEVEFHKDKGTRKIILCNYP